MLETLQWVGSKNKRQTEKYTSDHLGSQRAFIHSWKARFIQLYVSLKILGKPGLPRNQKMHGDVKMFAKSHLVISLKIQL